MKISIVSTKVFTYINWERSFRAFRMKFKQQQIVSEGTLQRIMRGAEEPWRRCDMEQCIEIMERARRLAPADKRILLNLGICHLKAHSYEAAVECFEKAIQ